MYSLLTICQTPFCLPVSGSFHILNNSMGCGQRLFPLYLPVVRGVVESDLSPGTFSFRWGAVPLYQDQGLVLYKCASGNGAGKATQASALLSPIHSHNPGCEPRGSLRASCLSSVRTPILALGDLHRQNSYKICLTSSEKSHSEKLLKRRLKKQVLKNSKCHS